MLHFRHDLTNVSTSDRMLYQKKLRLSFVKVLVISKCPEVGMLLYHSKEHVNLRKCLTSLLYID